MLRHGGGLGRCGNVQSAKKPYFQVVPVRFSNKRPILARELFSYVMLVKLLESDPVKRNRFT